MNEKVVDKEISFITLYDEDGKIYGYSAFLAGENESGITVTGDTIADCINKLNPYLLDSFEE